MQYENKRSLFKTIVILFISASFTLGQGLGDALSATSSLSPQLFDKPLDTLESDRSSIEAYLRYLLINFKGSGKDPKGLTLDDFQSIQAQHKRITFSECRTKEDGSYILVCAINGNPYKAVIERAGAEDPIVAVTKLDMRPVLSDVRFFPAVHTQGTLTIPRQVIDLAVGIGGVTEYTKNYSNIVDRNNLSDALVTLFKKAFFEENLLGSIDGIAAFFKAEDGMELEKIPISQWSLKEDIVRSIINEICSKHPDLKESLAKICHAVGKIFYIQREYGSFSRSELFFSLAHNLVPANAVYHNDWAWALFHCGKTTEARAAIDELLKTQPESNKLLTEMAYINLKELETKIKALERRRIASLPLDEFLNEESSIRLLITQVLNMTEKVSYRSPRLISAVGKTYELSARLYIFRQNYLLRFPRARSKAETKVLSTDIINALGESARYLKEAHERVGKGSPEAQAEHAKNMLTTILTQEFHLLKRCWDTVKDNSWGFPDRFAIVENSLTKITSALNINSLFSPDVKTDFEVLFNEIRGHISLQKHLLALFEKHLKNCREGDISDTKGFFARLKDTLISDIYAQTELSPAIARLKSVDIFVEDIISSYRNELALEPLDIAIVYVSTQALGTDEPTIENIRAYVELTGVTIPPDARQFRSRVLKITRALGLRELVEPRMEAAEGYISGRKHVSVADIDRSALTKSINPGEYKSVVSRLEHITKKFEPLRPWYEHHDIPEKYILGLRDQIETAKKRINTYKADVTRYLEVSKSGRTLSNREKRTLSFTGVGLMKDHGSIVEDLNTLEELLKRRYQRVKDVLSKQVVAIKTRQTDLGVLYKSLRIEWLNTQFTLLNSCVDNLMGLLNENDAEFLSYTKFLASNEDAENMLQYIAHFGEKLGSFKSTLAILEAAKDDAAATESFFGTCDILREYGLRLSEATQNIFRYALEGRAFDDLTRDEKDFYSNVALRTKFSENLRRSVKDKVNEVIPKASKFRLVELVSDIYGSLADRVFNKIKDDISASLKREENTIRQIYNLSTPFISDDEVNKILLNLTHKAEVLVDAEENLVWWNEFVKFKNIINKLAPDIVSSEELGHIDEMRTRCSQNIDSIAHLSIFNAAFDNELIERCAETLEDRNSINDITGTMITRWYRKLSEGVEVLRNFIYLWMDHWSEGLVPPDHIVKIKESFGKILDMLNAPKTSTELVSKLEDELQNLGEEFFELTVVIHKASINAEAAKRILTQAAHDFEAILNAKPSPINLDYEAIVSYRRSSSKIQDWGFRHSPEKFIAGTGMLISDGKPNTTAAFYLSIPLSNPDDSPIIAGINNRMQANIAETGLDRLFTAKEGEFEGIYINPLNFCSLIAAALRFYEKAVAPSYEWKNSIKDMRSMGIDEIFLHYCINEIYADAEKTIGKYVEDNPTISIVDHKLALLNDREKSGVGLTTAEKLRQESLMRFRRDFIAGQFVDWLDEETVNVFFKNILVVLGKMTGRHYPIPDQPVTSDMIPRLSLTLPEDKASISIYSEYPPDKDYKGVYFDARNLSFGVKSGGHTTQAKLLCDALNKSLSLFLDKVGFNASSGKDKDREWYKILEGLIKGVRKRGTIYIAISEKVPTNSLCVKDTIIFNKYFIEYILQTIEGVAREAREAPYLVLGERIIHELGLISIMAESGHEIIEEANMLNWEERWRARLLKDDSKQTHDDVVLYNRIFSRDHALLSKLEEYTDRKVDDKNTGTLKKFSHIFATKRLYKNIQVWTRMLRSDPVKMDQDIKLFVMDVLNGVIFRSPFTRFFPAVHAQGGLVSEEPSLATNSSLEFLAVQNLVDLFQKLDNSTLNTLDIRQADFLSKKRRIVISSNLIPQCQRSLIDEINKKSSEAFKSGRSHDLIEIRHLSYIENVRSDKDSSVVILLEQGEASLYRGKETRLIFAREGDGPIALNGLIAAGRAILFNDMDKLRFILSMLSGRPDLDLPSASELERLINEDKYEFARRLAIALPPMQMLSHQIEDLNSTILKVMPYA